MLDLMTAKFIASLFLPPSIFFILLLGAYLLRRRYPRSSKGVIFSSIISLYLLTLPIIAMIIIAPLQTSPALSEQEIQSPTAEAIVVLAGGRARGYKEYSGHTVSPGTLERIRYGAWLKRRTHLPIIVTGGRLKNEAKSEAQLMQEVLQKEFLIEVNATEDRARNTFENAIYTAKWLQRNNIKKIYLVTHAWHMPRSVEAFEQQSIDVIAAPTAYYGNNMKFLSLADFMPNVSAFKFSALALHEYLGIMWYRLRYY